MEKIRYILFFKKDTKELYAYTDNKKMAKNFKKFRVESIFFEKEVYLDPDSIQELYEECRSCWIISYIFTPYNIELPITEMEKLQMEHHAIQSIIELPLKMVPPEIFTEEVRNILASVGYDFIYNYYRINNKLGALTDIIQPNYFLYFLHLFGDTMKVVKTDESMDVLLKR